jgi:hypothetical protein
MNSSVDCVSVWTHSAFYGQYGAPVARVAAIHRLKAEKVFAAGAQGAPEERSHRSEGVSRLPAANP